MQQWLENLRTRVFYRTWKFFETIGSGVYALFYSPKSAPYFSFIGLLAGAFMFFVIGMNLIFDGGAKAYIESLAVNYGSFVYSVVLGFIFLGLIKPISDFLWDASEHRKFNHKRANDQFQQFLVTKSIQLDRDMTPIILDHARTGEGLVSTADVVAIALQDTFQRITGVDEVGVFVVSFDPKPTERGFTEEPKELARYGVFNRRISQTSIETSAQACLVWEVRKGHPINNQPGPEETFLKPDVVIIENLAYEVNCAKDRVQVSLDPNTGSEIVFPVANAQGVVNFGIVVLFDAPYVVREGLVETYRRTLQLLTGYLPLMRDVARLRDPIARNALQGIAEAIKADQFIQDQGQIIELMEELRKRLERTTDSNVDNQSSDNTENA